MAVDSCLDRASCCCAVESRCTSIWCTVGSTSPELASSTAATRRAWESGLLPQPFVQPFTHPEKFSLSCLEVLASLPRGWGLYRDRHHITTNFKGEIWGSMGVPRVVTWMAGRWGSMVLGRWQGRHVGSGSCQICRKLTSSHLTYIVYPASYCLLQVQCQSPNTALPRNPSEGWPTTGVPNNIGTREGQDSPP